MSPQRRQSPRAISSRTELKDLPNGVPVSKTRSGHEATSSESPLKQGKPVKESPSIKKSSLLKTTASPRRSLPCSISPRRLLRTHQNSPENLPAIKPLISKPESPVKKDSSSKFLVSKEKNAKVKVPVSKEPQSFIKAVEIVEKNLKTTPPRVAPQQLVTNVHQTLPTCQRITRGSSVGSSPLSSTLGMLKPSPLKSPKRAVMSPSKQCSAGVPAAESPSTRKRPAPSPPQSPQSIKARRLRGKILMPVQIGNEEDLENDCGTLSNARNTNIDEVRSSESKSPISISHTVTNKSELTINEDGLPEISGRYLRRKWFSLKARGGFTCLRSAILSPAEIAQEILQKTTVEYPPVTGPNFFSTKLMVRLSSKLPPVRARPSCEELVDMTNSHQSEKNLGTLTDFKGESTAIRVKVEKRSFSETISNIVNKPLKLKLLKSPRKPLAKLDPLPKKQQESTLTKRQEREIALRQLKNLRDL